MKSHTFMRMKSEMKYRGKMGASGRIGLGSLIFLITLIILAVYFFRSSRPCREPLTYRIGTVDTGFGLTRPEVAAAVRRASSLWGKSFSRELFRESSDGAIEINLVYDYRQESVDRLKNLSFKIDNTKGSYDDLKFRFEGMKAQYEQKSAALAGDFNAYNARVGALNAEMESGRQRGGVPEPVYRRLMAEKEEMKSVRENLQGRQEELKREVDTVNSMAVVINQIATNYNLDLVDYRDAGSKLGGEFYGGEYIVKNGKRTITIYQFDDHNKLVRVLAHELGHALGLNHNENPQAIMYRLNQSDSLELAREDINALKSRCDAQ